MMIFLGWSADYDKIMVQQLKKKLKVHGVNFPEGRFIFWINKRTKYFLIKAFLFVVSRFFPVKAVLVFKDSDGYGYHNCLSLFRQKKVLIVRNVISREDASKFLSKFSIVYSFDKEQCEKYGLSYMPQIFPLEDIDGDDLDNENSCYFIGIDKGRINTIDLVAMALSKYNIQCDFNVLRDRTSREHSKFYIDKGITYQENISRAKKQKFILEINQEGQSGLTLRALESLFFGKKLISNNPDLKDYDFYDESRIFIFNDLNDFETSKFKVFILSDYKPVQEELLNNYKASYFFSNVANGY